MKRFKQIARWVLGSAILVALGVMLVRNVHQLDWSHVRARPWALALIALACVLELLLQYGVWWQLLNRRHKLMSFGDGYFLFTMSSLSRYLPAGKVWQVVSFFHFGENAEIGAASLYAYAVSMVSGMLAGALIAAVGMPLLFPAIDSRIAALAALLLFVASLALTNERVLGRLGRLAGKRLAVLAQQRALTVPELLVLIAVQAISWLIEGACALVLMRMVDPTLTTSTMWLFLTAYAFANFAGYASLITPAGLGVREGVLVLLLLPHMPVPVATFVTLTMRCALTVADVLFAAPLGVRFFAGRIKKARAA